MPPVRRRTAAVPTYLREAMPRGPSTGVVETSGLVGIGGIAAELMADVSKTLAVDALRRQAEKVRAEAVPEGFSAGVAAAQAGGDLPRATNEVSAGARAYDAGAIAGYTAGVQNRIRSGLDEIAGRHDADPDGFSAEAEQFRAKFDHIPPQLRGDFDLAFGQVHDGHASALEKVRSARAAEANELETRTLLADLERQISAKARAGDVGKVTELAESHDLELMAGIEGGSMTGLQAAEARNRRNAQIRWHSVMGRFDDALADGLPAALRFRAEFRADRDTMDISAAEADALDARMAAEISAARVAAERAARVNDAALAESRTRLRADFKSMVAVAKATGQLPPAWETVRGVAETLDPETALAMRQVEEDLSWRGEFRKLPPAEQVAELEDLKRQALEEGEPHAREALAGRIEDGRDMLADIAKAAVKDRLTTAEALGVVEPTPLDPNDADTFAARARAEDAASRHWGLRPGGPFKPAEVEGVVETIESQTDTRARLDIARAYVTQWPDAETRSRALAQLIRDGKLPEAYATALEIAGDDASDTPRRMTAERVLGDLEADVSGLDATVAKDTRADAQVAYDDARGAVLGHAAAYNPGLADRLARERAEAVQVAQARALAGASNPTDAAMADLFGRERAIDDDRLAHILIPADTDLAQVRRGLLALRAEAADRLAGQAPPGLDRMGRLTFDKAIEQTREFGVWVPNGVGYSLIVPHTQRPVAGDDGRPWVVTIDQVLAAAPPPSADPLEGFDMRYGLP